VAAKPPNKIKSREAAARLLLRRPDLAARRKERTRARKVCEAVGMSAAAVDSLAGWLGADPTAEVADAEQALAARLQLRLAALPPAERQAFDGPGGRAAVALDLGWERLEDAAARELLRCLSLAESFPRSAAEAMVPPESALAALGSGFVIEIAPGRLAMTKACRKFLKPAAKQHAELRRGHLFEGLRQGLGGVADEDLSPVIEEAWALSPGGVRAAALAHRAAERLRRIGSLDAARLQVQRGLDCLEGEDAAGLRGLLLLDRGLAELEAGRIADADATLAEAQALLAADPDGQHAALRARLGRAQALAWAGHSEAEAELSAVLTELESEGDEPVSLAARAVAEHALATLLLRRGEVGAALGHGTRAREDWEDATSDGDAQGAVFDLGLAQALRAAGRASEVDEPLERARVLSGGNLDRPAHAALPVALHDLAVAAGDRGDWKAARTLVDEASMMGRSLRPDDHALQASLRCTRAQLDLAEGDNEAALDQAQRARVRHGASLPEDHPALALLDATEGWTRAQQGLRSEALVSLERAEQNLRAVRGERSNALAHVRLLRRSLDG
jgi:hypothetical protein